MEEDKTGLEATQVNLWISPENNLQCYEYSTEIKVKYLIEFSSRSKNRTAKPYRISLNRMTDHIHFYRLGLKLRVNYQLKRWQNYNKVFGVASIFSVNNRAITNKKNCTFASPLTRALDERTRASTIFLRSRCNLLWKSLNIVEPPDKTIFCDNVKRHKVSEIYESKKNIMILQTL
jgi:hypothetical protein